MGISIKPGERKLLRINGYTVEIVRQERQGESYGGHLCGYITIPRRELRAMRLTEGYGVSEPHPGIKVHGGVTYSEETHMGLMVGFDCAHGCDMHNPKDEGFVLSELVSVIEQLKELGKERV